MSTRNTVKHQSGTTTYFTRTFHTMAEFTPFYSRLYCTLYIRRNEHVLVRFMQIGCPMYNRYIIIYRKNLFNTDTSICPIITSYIEIRFNLHLPSIHLPFSGCLWKSPSNPVMSWTRCSCHYMKWTPSTLHLLGCQMYTLWRHSASLSPTRGT